MIITVVVQTPNAESAGSCARTRKRIQKGGFALFLRKLPSPLLRVRAHAVSRQWALSRPPAHREEMADSPEAEEPEVDEAVRGRNKSA